MDKIKIYKEQESRKQNVADSMVAYEVVERNVEDYLKAIPQDVMQSLVDRALEDYELGCCTPQSQMDSWIKKRMGWK